MKVNVTLWAADPTSNARSNQPCAPLRHYSIIAGILAVAGIAWMINDKLPHFPGP